MASDYNKRQAPGKLRMKCMLWEPRPISTRRMQDNAMVYDGTTLAKVSTLPQGTFDFFEDPPSLNLVPVIVARDTFIKGGVSENIASLNPDMFTLRHGPIFNSANEYTESWMYHQTFQVIGSVFQSKSAAPSTDGGNDDTTFNMQLSKWEYAWDAIAENKAGKADSEDSPAADEFSIVGTDNESYSQWRKSYRIYPRQIQVSADGNRTVSPSGTSGASGASGTSGASGSSGTKPPAQKAIHWLVEKTEPLFNKQDFTVELIPQAYQTDIVAETSPMLADYAFIDPTKTPTADPKTGRAVVVNSAVVPIGQDGTPMQWDQESSIALSREPYYMIEVGKGDKDHHYVILLAYNHYPRFIQVGKSPIVSLGSVSSVPPSGDESDFFADPDEVVVTPQQPVVITPDKDCGVCISQYDQSCRSLMKDRLTVTVRNHLGCIVVYFNGDLGRPWVISRSDYEVAEKSQPDQNVGDMPRKPIYMRVPAGPLRIAAGNILAGFRFSPLHYRRYGRFPLPDAIACKGPLKDTDVNCFLREKEERKIKGSKNPKSARYFQEADIYHEVVKGARFETSRDATLQIDNGEYETIPGWTADKKRSLKPKSALQDVPVGPDGKLSFIRIAKTTQLSTVQNPSDPSSSSSGDSSSSDSPPSNVPTETVKFFRAEYVLGAGDMTVGQDDPKKKWTIPNCTTPIATGWRLNVPPQKNPRYVCPVTDVAHHVLSFSSQWNFNDFVKVEHSGTIKFLINFGDMTGTASSGPLFTPTGCAAKPDDPYSIDQSSMLTQLVDRTFFVRIYAWWEGGYMECTTEGCPCKRGPAYSDVHRKVLFTGLAHGGQVTVEAGKRVMECQLLDYWKILEDQNFLNSPFFDGMRDFNAVKEVLDMTGFISEPDPDGVDPWAPGQWIKKCADSDLSTINFQSNGEQFWVQEYPLPTSFDQLQNPILKFADNENYADAIVKFARFAGKMCYFDRFGVFRMTNRPDQYFCNPTHPSFRPKCNFFASPVDLPTKCTELNSLAINPYTYRRNVAEIVNEIQVISTQPSGELLIRSGVNLPSKTDPSKPGYLGYTKRLLQVDGIFGSEKAVNKVVQYYTGFYKPPVSISWESMGSATIVAGDTVTFTGLRLDNTFPPPTRDPMQNLPNGNGQSPTTTVYVTTMSTEIDPARNTWTNKYEGEWIFTGEVECSDQSQT